MPAESKPVVQPHQSSTAPLLEKPVSEPLQQPIAEDEGMFLTVVFFFFFGFCVVIFVNICILFEL